MVDIETLGTGDDAVVAQIAMVKFNPYDDTQGYDYLNIFLNIPQQRDRKIDPATFAFWMQQPKSTFDYVFRGDVAVTSVTAYRRDVSVLDAYKHINDFLHTGNPPVRFWANSPRFDLEILENLFRTVSPMLMSFPPQTRQLFPFRQHSDVRTIRAAMEDFGIELPSFKGMKHDAMSDAMFQVELVQKFFFNAALTMKV